MKCVPKASSSNVTTFGMVPVGGIFVSDSQDSSHIGVVYVKLCGQTHFNNVRCLGYLHPENTAIVSSFLYQQIIRVGEYSHYKDDSPVRSVDKFELHEID